MTFRFIVTGSRDWEDKDLIWRVLSTLVPPYSTLIHGDCPTGADSMADEWAQCQPDITVERHPAEWQKFGRKAGPLRNKEMIDLGAKVVFAFIKDNSRGASGTVKLANDADILVVKYEA